MTHSTSPSDRLPDSPEPDPGRVELAQEGLDLKELWESVRASLKETIAQTPFYTWFQQAALQGLNGERATIAVQNDFTRNWLVDNYRQDIARAVKAVLGRELDVAIVVDPELVLRRPPRKPETPAPGAAPTTPGAPPWKDAAPAQPRGLLRSSDVTLNPGYTFDNYVVGPCNRFAHAAAMGVSEAPGRYHNPFFLYGTVGLGKTHLLQSLCHAILEADPTSNILFLSCETFTNHFIEALKDGDLSEFRHKYRDVDVLVVDDIHMLRNKERTQEEFFHTFNVLYNAGKQIVLSSDSPPKDIPTLQERLVSRFNWGLVIEIEPPCYETRMAILKRKCRERGGDLPDEVAQTLAERLDSNIRELEGSVNKLLGFSKLMGEPITIELARRCLQDVFTVRTGPISMDDVAGVVTKHFDVRLSDLQSKKRTQAIAWPRQLAMYLSRRITKRSLKDIGGFYGGRDHSTVLHAVKKIEVAVTEDAALQDLVADLELRLKRSL